MAPTTITDIAPDGYYTLVHPEHNDITAKADVIGFYKDAGRTVGLELHFHGEHHTRHLRFVEIKRLMAMAIEDLLQEVREFGNRG